MSESVRRLREDTRGEANSPWLHGFPAGQKSINRASLYRNEARADPAIEDF